MTSPTDFDATPTEVDPPELQEAVDQCLELFGVEDIAHWYVQEVDGRWRVAMKRTADGDWIDLPKSFDSPGPAIDYLYQWAAGRGLVITDPVGKVRRYITPRVDAMTSTPDDEQQ